MKTQTELDHYLNLAWHYSVAPSNWEGQKGYWAWVSELPNCSTFAPTPAEALSAVAQLLPAYLKALLESKATVPLPDSRDIDASEAGGTIVLRIPKSLHLGLKNAAKAEKTSLNQFALYALTKMVCQTTVPTEKLATPSLKGMLKKADKPVSTGKMRETIRRRGAGKR